MYKGWTSNFCIGAHYLPHQKYKKSFNTTGVKNRVFRRSNPSCEPIGWMARLCEPSLQKLKNLPAWKNVQHWWWWQPCFQNDVSMWESWCECAKERRKRTNSGRCLVGCMVMHACQTGPTDTAPPCLGSPHRAGVGTREEIISGTQKQTT